MTQGQRIAQADERAKALARMSDERMAAAYSEMLLDPLNLNLSPYLVTAVRDLGLWPRLVDALANVKEASR